MIYQLVTHWLVLLIAAIAVGAWLARFLYRIYRVPKQTDCIELDGLGAGDLGDR